jgi:cytochrome c oxidase subunit 2
MIVTSNDVIHAFAVPSLGVKIDAMPGRLNTIGFTISRPTVLYGQCSELCGVLHSAMPIQINAVSIPSYLGYIQSSI